MNSVSSYLLAYYGSDKAQAFRAAPARGTERVLRRMVDDLVEIAKLFATGFANSTGEIKKALIHATVYGFLVSTVFLLSFIVRADFDVSKGLREAYAHSWLSPSSGYSQIHSQDALRAGIRSNTVVQAMLNTILRQAPFSSRVRLALIHDGVTTITGVDLLRFDVTNAVAAPGRIAGELETNLPLSEWGPDYLPALMKHECALNEVAALQNTIRRDRLQSYGSSWVLACPVIDINDQIFGSVFVSWDGNEKPPTGPALGELMQRVKDAGKQLGYALDMQRSSN